MLYLDVSMNSHTPAKTIPGQEVESSESPGELTGNLKWVEIKAKLTA